MRREEARALERDDGGGAFDCLMVVAAVSGAPDRDCAADCGRGGTGGRDGGGSALFDDDARVIGSRIIDRDLRNVSDSLRRRNPVEGDAADDAGKGDGDLVEDGNVGMGGCGVGCCARRGTVFGRGCVEEVV